MKISFSWLRKIAEDADRLSSFGSALACVLLLAGTLALSAEKLLVPENEAAEIREAVPARIAVRVEHFVAVPEVEEITPLENAPGETPLLEKTPPPPPEPEPTPEEKNVEKIDDSALRETLSESVPEPPKKEPPPEKKENPKPLPPPLPPKQVAPAPPSPPVPAVDQAAHVAAEQSLYGALAEAVSQKKFYPRAARRNGRTGTVFIRVQISDCGKIKSYEIEKSDAHKSLIAGAKETLRRVAEDFSAPAGTQAALPAAFIVPVVYELN